jgi:hypothetical protein
MRLVRSGINHHARPVRSASPQVRQNIVRPSIACASKQDRQLLYQGATQATPTPSEKKVKTSPFVLMSSMLLALPVHAQQFPETERQKAQEDRERAHLAHKKAKEQEIDEDYRSLMERTPSVGKKADPWGNLRAPSSGK